MDYAVYIDILIWNATDAYINLIHDFLCKEAGDKYPIFCKQHFKMHFVEWKYLNLHNNFTEIHSSESSWQKLNSGSENGLVLSHYLNHWWFISLIHAYIYILPDLGVLRNIWCIFHHKVEQRFIHKLNKWNQCTRLVWFQTKYQSLPLSIWMIDQAK